MAITGYSWILGFGNGNGSYYNMILDLGFWVLALGALGALGALVFKASHLHG